MKDHPEKTEQTPEKREGARVRFTSGYTDIPLPFGRKETPAQKRAAKPENAAYAPGPRTPSVERAGISSGPDDDSALPEKIREMRSIAPDYSRFPYSKNLHFYRQGKLMENYEDDYIFHGRFVRYFPTYQMMNNDQLRGYFSWRTKVRTYLRSVVKKGSNPSDAETADLFNPDETLSFLYLYIYELIEGIGVQSEPEGYALLQAIDALCGPKDSRLHRHLQNWMADYVIYYGLDRSLAARYFHTDLDDAMELAASFERALTRTEDAETDPLPEDAAAVRELFLAINALSRTDLTRSPVYRQNADDLMRAALLAYSRICLFYYRNGKPMVLEQSFGGRGIYPYRMFDAAVFYDHRHYDDYTYEVDKAHIFHCANGVWQCEKYLMAGEKSRVIGMIFHETDRVLRNRTGAGRPLQPRLRSTVLAGLIESAVDDYLKEKEERMRPKVHIDPAHLASIRSDAAHTREQLITEEEMGEPAEFPLPEEKQTAAPGPGAPDRTGTGPSGPDGSLTDDQASFLRLLLSGGDWRGFIASRKITLSLFIDEINETLYDEIGDTVIDTSSGVPEIIEDYRPDLEAILSPRR